MKPPTPKPAAHVPPPPGCAGGTSRVPDMIFARAAIALVMTALLAVCVRPACAEESGNLFLEDGASVLQDYSMTVGGFTELGSGELSGWKYASALTPTARGVRIYERNGFISGTIAAIVMSMAGGMAANGPKKVESTDYGSYRVVKTTYYSPAEKAAMLAATSAAASGLFASAHQSFDLQIYTRNLGGHSEGWRMNGMVVGIPFADDRGMFDFGFGYAKVVSAVGVNGQYLISTYHYGGVPMRLSYALGPVVLYAHFDWNWLGHSDSVDYNSKNNGTQNKPAGAPPSNLTEIQTTGFPWRFGAQAALLGRLYLEGALVTPKLTSGELGFHTSAGLRF